MQKGVLFIHECSQHGMSFFFAPIAMSREYIACNGTLYRRTLRPDGAACIAGSRYVKTRVSKDSGKHDVGSLGHTGRGSAAGIQASASGRQPIGREDHQRRSMSAQGTFHGNWYPWKRCPCSECGLLYYLTINIFFHNYKTSKSFEHGPITCYQLKVSAKLPIPWYWYLVFG